jgi:hypothetical protein
MLTRHAAQLGHDRWGKMGKACFDPPAIERRAMWISVKMKT